MRNPWEPMTGDELSARKRRPKQVEAIYDMRLKEIKVDYGNLSVEDAGLRLQLAKIDKKRTELLVKELSMNEARLRRIAELDN